MPISQVLHYNYQWRTDNALARCTVSFVTIFAGPLAKPQRGFARSVKNLALRQAGSKSETMPARFFNVLLKLPQNFIT